MNKENIIGYLKNIENNYEDSFRFNNILQIIIEEKKKEVIKGNENEAKEYWCLEESVKIQNFYISAFNLLKEGNYYEAWCNYCYGENHIHFLSKHLEINDKYELKFISEHIMRYQKIFPYKIFASAGILENEIRCSICDKILTPRNKCEHKRGEIYKGEMCCRIIAKWELVEYSMVKDPIDKCCVTFLSSENGEKIDQYNYAFLKYLIKRLSSPFDEWNFEISKRRHPHSRYKHIEKNYNCPCESGKKYENCCLKEEGVLRPHIEFLFSNPPSDELRFIEYI